MNKSILSLAAFLLFSSSVQAEAPRVVTDIPPIHSLVSAVMQGVGTPDVLLQGQETPHDYAMRPQSAAALQSADIILIASFELMPWLEKSVRVIATKAEVFELDNVAGAIHLESREDFHDDHDHGAYLHDPHTWLSIDNALLWINFIEKKLIDKDTKNKAVYIKNAEQERLKIQTMKSELHELLEPFKGRTFAASHDNIQYLEADFGIKAVGAITLTDHKAATVGRVRELQKAIVENQVTCLILEPGENRSLAQTVAKNQPIKFIELDVLGSQTANGVNLYREMMRKAASNLVDCLT